MSSKNGKDCRDGKGDEGSKNCDTFEIYQLRSISATRPYRFEPHCRLKKAGLSVDRENYRLIYSAPLDGDMTLENIFIRFNIDRPVDFTGHSLSVSDVIVLHRNGSATTHYVDSVGFVEVPEFLGAGDKEG